MSGGRANAATHMASFPVDIKNAADAWKVSSYQTDGVDAVFFMNAGSNGGFLVQWDSVEADPNP